ncbi:hypothetical protein GF371_05100 [Candidatus Woesearchaeota archaeon]|nr:hypothetical protein [Candidatus Woesearchaeota archaeon]
MPYTQEQAQQLANYLKRQKEAGYSITTLRNYLVSKGYDAQLVDSAIDLMYKPAKKTIPFRFQLPRKFLLFLVIIIVIIGGAGFSLYFLLGGEEAAEEPEVRLPAPVGREVEEPAMPEIPQVPEKKAPAPVEEEPEPMPEPVPEPTPEPEPTVRPLIEEGPDPNAIEIEDNLKKMSESKGFDYCKSLVETKRNTCFKYLALEQNKTEYCGYIDESNLRDNCYILFAFSGDFTVCDKIENKYQQLSCRSLGRARKYSTEELLAKAKQAVVTS